MNRRPESEAAAIADEPQLPDLACARCSRVIGAGDVFSPYCGGYSPLCRACMNFVVDDRAVLMNHREADSSAITSVGVRCPHCDGMIAVPVRVGGPVRNQDDAAIVELTIDERELEAVLRAHGCSA